MSAEVESLKAALAAARRDCTLAIEGKAGALEALAVEKAHAEAARAHGKSMAARYHDAVNELVTERARAEKAEAALDEALVSIDVDGFAATILKNTIVGQRTALSAAQKRIETLELRLGRCADWMAMQPLERSGVRDLLIAEARAALASPSESAPQPDAKQLSGRESK